MAEYNKDRYYWLKLKRDFFKRHDIQVIESMPNGKDYVLFYLKLMVESIDHDGTLRFSDTIPYNDQMLSVVTNTNIDIVRSAIKLLSELGMVEVLDDKTLYLKEVSALIGSQTAGAERRQIQRQNQAEKMLGRQMSPNCHPEIEIEKELVSKYEEKEINIKDTIGRAHACESYQEIIDNMQVEEGVVPMIWDFIKHCQLNGKTLTNAKLTDILIFMDCSGYDERKKIQALKDAINGGYYDIKRG